MTRRWMPDPGWTGQWALPALLQRPITQSQRAGLVSLSCEGAGPARIAKSIGDAERWEDVLDRAAASSRTALRSIDRLGARAIVPSDAEYPELLSAIDAPPPLLFARGAPLHDLQPAVAIVGARACTTGAARFAERLGASFAAAGLVVVSGLARGIDVAAHVGALQAGRTIAVLGTGIDVVYPPEHDALALRITRSGAIVTEFPPGVGPRAWHFPARNRIISGLSIAVVVVEAGLRSGALITAGFALDQGREVFACTTGPENPAGAGTRELLKDGAGLIIDAEQAVEVVTGMLGDQGYAFARPADEERAVDLTGDLRRVYDAIAEDSTPDQIAAHVGLPSARAASLLAELQLEGLVDESAGRWRRS